MSKFSVGDKVEVSGTGSPLKGKTCVVSYILADGSVIVALEAGGYSQAFDERELELVEKPRKFKVGDRVSRPGRSGEVFVIDELHDINLRLVRVTGNKRWWNIDFLVAASEFSVGDVVLCFPDRLGFIAGEVTAVKGKTITIRDANGEEGDESVDTAVKIAKYPEPITASDSFSTTYNFDDGEVTLRGKGPGNLEEVSAIACVWRNDIDDLRMDVEFTFTPENCTGKCGPNCPNPLCGPMNVSDQVGHISRWCTALASWIARNHTECPKEALKSLYELDALAAAKSVLINRNK